MKKKFCREYYIDAALMRWNAQNWNEFSAQHKTTVEEARKLFLERFQQGHGYYMSEPCDGFSPKTGCPGHGRD